jgi:hypothetical protein
MSMEFTRKQYLEVWRDDRYISRHTSLQECAESASFDADINDEATYEIRVGSEVWYTVSIRHLTSTALADLIIKRNDNPPTNSPPVWDSQPNPTFVNLVASNYSLVDLTSDPDMDSVNVLLDTGTTALGTGLTYNGTTDEIEYDGTDAVATTTGHIATADDGTDTTASNAFNVVVQAEDVQLYPLTCSGRGANRAPFQDDAITATDRLAMGLIDAVQTIGLDSGTQADTDPPAANYLSRAEAYQEILDAHPTSESYVFCYHNVTEAFDNTGTARSTKIKNFIDAMNGPGSDDGWAYNSANEKVLLFGDQYTINNSDYVAETAGQTYPEWYATEIAQLEYFDVMAAAGIGVGKGGANIFLDNHQLHSNKGGIDWNNDGNNDNAQNYYDSEESAHIAGDAVAVQAYSESRANFRKAPETWTAANPGTVTLVNTNQWWTNPVDRNTYIDDPSELRNCILEYRLAGDPDNGYNQTGLSENNSTNKTTSWPRSGVGANGENRVGQSGKWLHSYCNLYQSVKLAQSPSIIFGLWSVECMASGTSGAAGITIYPNAPATNAVWHMVRWCIATCWLAGAHAGIGGIRVGTEKSGRAGTTPLFDEYGLINGSINYNSFGSGNTKLYRQWMGLALGPPPIVAAADGSWQREFTNALVIVNPDNDEGNSAMSVDVSALPGGASEWSRFVGDQDNSHNDGTAASTDFNLDPIDAIILVRKAWYDAL